MPGKSEVELYSVHCLAKRNGCVAIQSSARHPYCVKEQMDDLLIKGTYRSVTIFLQACLANLSIPISKFRQIPHREYVNFKVHGEMIVSIILLYLRDLIKMIWYKGLILFQNNIISLSYSFTYTHTLSLSLYLLCIFFSFISSSPSESIYVCISWAIRLKLFSK